MTDRSPIGVVLIMVGVGLVGLGALVWLGLLSWFGRLPGDIRVERVGIRFYAPITSMIIISILLTLLASLVRRFWP